MGSLITPALRRAFLDECHRRQCDPRAALEEAVADWIGVSVDAESRQVRRRGRPVAPRVRGLRRLSSPLIAALQQLNEHTSQKVMAQRSNMSHSVMSQWMRGVTVAQRPDAIAAVERLCAMVQVPFNDAFEIVLCHLAPPEIKAAA